MEPNKDNLGWGMALAGAVATAITWFFSHFASVKALEKLEEKVDNFLIQYNKDRLVQEKIYDVFVREGKIK